MTMKTIQPDFDLGWERGYESIAQEGSLLFLRLRKEKHWSWEDVHELTDYALPPPRQELIEDYQDFPTFDELVAFARIYEMSPGELIDLVLEEADPRRQETNRVTDEFLDRIQHAEHPTTLEVVQEVAAKMGLEVKDARWDGDAILVTYLREDISERELRIGSVKP